MSDDVQILVGDCRAVLGTLAAGSVRCVVTSPRYNLGASPSAGEHPNSSRGQTFPDWSYEADNDYTPEPEYEAEQQAVLAALAAVTTPDASVFYVHKDRLWDGVLISPLAWLTPATGWMVRQQIVWDRGSTHNRNRYYTVPQHEYVFWLKKPDASGGTRHWNVGACADWGSVWRIPPPPASYKPWHPCPFPPALAERCILLGSQPGDLVLDPYSGSGTTLDVARQLGRRARGIERQPRYVELALRDLGVWQPRLLLEDVA